MAEQWWEDAPLVDNPAPASTDEEQWWSSAPVVEPAAPQEESGALSILGRSLMRGTADAVTGVGQSGQLLTQGADSLKPEVGPSDDPELDRLLKQSVGEGWTDPNWWVANTMTPLAGSSPTLAGAIGGAALGAGTTRNPYAAAVGGAAGGAAAAVMQTLGPSYVQALQDGLNPDDAFERAWTQAGVSGAFSAVAGALPMAAVFGRTAEGALKAPIKEALLQMFVAQPGVGVAEQVVQTGIEGKEVTADDLAKAYIGEAVAGGALDVGVNLATGGYRPSTVAERGPSQEETAALASDPTAAPGEAAPAPPVAADETQAITEQPILSPVERAKEIARRRAEERTRQTPPVTDPAPVASPNAGATEPPTASVGQESAAPPVTEEVTEQPAPNEEITANVPPEPPAPQKSELFDKAVEAVRSYNSPSIGFLRGRLRISDAKARQLIFELEDAGVVSKPNERGIRTVIRDEVTPESNTPNEEITANVPPDSTFVPEAPETIEAQRQALVAGKKKAVMYSPDQPVPDLPGEGVVRGQFKVDGKPVVIDFNPKLTNYGKIQQAIRKNKLNELLDLGPVNKQAVAESAAAGAAPVAVTERTPGGTEVKAAAGTVETAPEQVQALEETKTAPENTVAVEAPEQVVEERTTAPPVRRIDPGTLSDEERQRLTEASAPKPRVLQDQSPESQYARELTDEANAPIKKRVKQAAKEIAKGEVYEEPAPKGKNRTKAEKQQREDTNTRADQLFANTAPSEAERTTEFGFMDQNPVVRNKARAAIRERAKAIITAARAAGLRLPAKVSDNTDEAMNLSDGAVAAVMARDFLAALKNPDPNKSIEEIYQDFLTDDMLLRNGQRDAVLGKRRSDNDTRTRADNEAAVETAESQTLTPEQTVEAKEEGDEVAREALQRDFGPNYTAANRGTAGVKVETKKRRTVYKSEAGTSGGPTRELRPDDVLQEVTFAEAYDQAAATPGTAINRSIIDGILNRLRQKVGKVPVLVVNQSALDQMYGGVNQVDGYYDPQKGHIVVSENFLVGGEFDARLLAHEGLHSWLQEAINSNASLKKDIQQILDVARARATAKNQKFRGLKDIHEFISEAMSDPDFQNFLMATKLPPNLAAKYDTPQGSLWRGFLRVIQKYLGSQRDLNALDYAIRLTERADAIAEERSQNLASVMDLEDQMRQRGLLSEGRQQRNYADELKAAGVPDDVAAELGGYIQRELGNEIDPATLPLFMGDLIKEFAVTSGGNAPPSGPTNTALPGTPAPAAPMPSTPKGRATWIRGLSVKLNTLDYIRQKYNSYFNGLLDPYIKTIQKYEDIVANVSEKHDKDGAEFLELMHRDPKEATAMANLAMEATSLNVRLGPGADNSHIGVDNNPASKKSSTKKSTIQARQRLAGLNARFDQLKPETRDLYKRMIANYRETHNDNIRALAYNLLVDMDLKNRLSNSDLMMLLDKTVNGTLTREDAAVIGEPKIYKELKRATSLRVIKGDYFPQMRFGNFVVLSKDKIADPRITFVTTKSNKRIPAKTTVTDNVVSFKIDSLARGGQAAMNRMIKDYIEKSDLTLLRATKTIVDKQTGKTVKTGEMDLAKDYDISWNLEFQTRGVNFFESRSDAQKFRDELAKNSGSQLDELSEVLDRREDGGQFDKIISGSALTEVTKRIDARKDIPTWQRKQMRAAVQEAIVSQMTGNRAQKRHMARRNVKGASKDIARAAITYGQAAGNYYATLTTSGDLRKSFSAVEEFEAQNASKEGGGVRSMVMNELRARHETMMDPLYLNKFIQNVAALSFFDKLVSPAYSIINFQQAIGNGLPYLGGKYGNARTAVAIAGAYRKIGALATLASGAKNTATAVAQLRKSAIDTTDLVGSIRKKLGAKYEPLMDELIERGLVSPNSGFEIGQAIVDGSGAFNTGIAKFDRIARQLPNAVEAVNRTVVAVAAFDLATSRGKSVKDAVQEAYDAVANTQGDYRRSNNPRFMNNRFLSWALQFKKYAVLQTQLVGDYYARALKGATPEDRAIARKQLATQMAVQVLYAGALGLPGLELLKLGVAVAAMLGFGDGWEEFEEEVKALADEAIGETWSELLRKGVVTRAIGIDVADRMSQADLWTGFMPPKLDREGMMQYAGSLLLGAPGSTLFDWFDAARELADGNVQKALEKAVPIKAVADTIRAVDQAQDGKMTAGEAVVKSIGFQPSRTANINEERSAEIRESRKVTEERNKLRNEYINATSKADIIRLRARIREFNRKQGKDGRKLSITTLEKYRRREMQRYRSE